MARILIVDDEANICWALQAFLCSEGHEVQVAGTAAEALALLGARLPDLVMSDIRLPGMSGIEILERCRALSDSVPVVLMTAYGRLDAAVDAMHKGAFEYLHKPLDLERVKDVVDRALTAGVRTAVTSAADETDPADGMPRIVGRSVAMQEVYKLIGLVSQSDVTVLVEGESGVGKELVARAIHHYSRRRQRAFVPINCGALPETLLESELFGYERGAFTGAVSAKPGRFELADGGTLFLDEVSELSLGHQAKLLRVLQDGSVDRLGATRPMVVDARVIAASNRRLRDAVASREFRQDLYFRLQIITVEIPPLRERPEDIADLVSHFLAVATRETGREIRGLDAAAADSILRYPWPGNVRELENVVRRAVVLTRMPVIGLGELPPQVAAAARAPSQNMSKLRAAAEAELRARLEQRQTETSSIYHEVIGTIETSLVQTALALTNGNQVRAADLLGVNRMTLRKRMSAESQDSGA